MTSFFRQAFLVNPDTYCVNVHHQKPWVSNLPALYGLKDVVTSFGDVCHDFQLMCINSLKAFQHFDALEELQQQIEAAETQAALARSAMVTMVTATTQQGLSKDEGVFVLASAGKIGGDIVGTSLLLVEWYLERKVIVFCSVSSKFVSPLITSHFCVPSTFVLDNHQMDWKWRQKGIRHVVPQRGDL